MVKLWEEDATLTAALAEVRSLLFAAVENSHSLIKPLLQAYISNGGKMLRPALVLLGSQLGKADYQERATRAAAVIELVHLASLIHDDIIDQATTRRNLPTFYHQHGPKRAVLAGDYLLSQALTLLDEQGEVEVPALANAFGRLCNSELDQDNGEYDFLISRQTYLRRIAGKTASLFALSSYLGAATTEASCSDQQHLHRFGYLFGMAFQIQDDILDYVGNEENLGKKPGRDLACGIPTLPLIIALEREEQLGANTPLRTYVAERNKVPSRRRIGKIIALVQSYGGIEGALEVATTYQKRALSELEKLSNDEVAQQLQALHQRLDRRLKS